MHTVCLVRGHKGPPRGKGTGDVGDGAAGRGHGAPGPEPERLACHPDPKDTTRVAAGRPAWPAGLQQGRVRPPGMLVSTKRPPAPCRPPVAVSSVQPLPLWAWRSLSITWSLLGPRCSGPWLPALGKPWETAWAGCPLSYPPSPLAVCGQLKEAATRQREAMRICSVSSQSGPKQTQSHHSCGLIFCRI